MLLLHTPFTSYLLLTHSLTLSLSLSKIGLITLNDILKGSPGFYGKKVTGFIYFYRNSDSVMEGIVTVSYMNEEGLCFVSSTITGKSLQRFPLENEC